MEENNVVTQPVGRPSHYTQELASRICEEIASGKSIRKVCAVEGMPCMASIFLWLQRHKDFSEQYARATAERREVHKESLFDIPREEGLDPASKRLLCDNIKWTLSKEDPKKYGDKIQLDGDLNHKHTHKTIDEIEIEIMQGLKTNPLLVHFLQTAQQKIEAEKQ